MATLDTLFGIHADAMAVHRRRMEVLAANIANADTPGYQARDVDFQSVLKQAAAKAGSAGQTPPLQGSHPQHLALTAARGGVSAGTGTGAAGDGLVYRVATQPSADGNTVDTQVEQAQFADAAMHYQASLSFADARIKSLMTAITGQ